MKFKKNLKKKRKKTSMTGAPVMELQIGANSSDLEVLHGGAQQLRHGNAPDSAMEMLQIGAGSLFFFLIFLNFINFFNMK